MLQAAICLNGKPHFQNEKRNYVLEKFILIACWIIFRNARFDKCFLYSYLVWLLLNLQWWLVAQRWLSTGLRRFNMLSILHYFLMNIFVLQGLLQRCYYRRNNTCYTDVAFVQEYRNVSNINIKTLKSSLTVQHQPNEDARDTKERIILPLCR